jgi:hypothetical protein
MTAAIGNDAERAAMVAAILHLNEGARTAGKAFDQVRRGVPDRHDVVDHRLRRIGETKSIARLRPRCRTKLLGIAENAIGLGHSDECLRLGLRRAAGDDDLRLRALAPKGPDRLPRLTHRLRRDGAGIDHHCVGQAGAFRFAADHFRLGGIEPAAEGDDIDAHRITVLPRRRRARRRSVRRARIRPARSSARGRRFHATRSRDRRRAR